MSAKAHTDDGTDFEQTVAEIAADTPWASVAKTVTNGVSPTDPDKYAVLTVDAGAVDAVPASLLIEISAAGLSVIKAGRTAENRVALKVAGDV